MDITPRDSAEELGHQKPLEMLASTTPHSTRQLPSIDRKSSKDEGATSDGNADSGVALKELTSQICLQGSVEGAKSQAQPQPLARSQTEQNVVLEGIEGYKISPSATQLYTISYLVLFAIWGTVARLALQAITFYPGAPVAFSELWANFAGSVIMGFLMEDRKLFKNEWGTPTYHQRILKARQQEQDEEQSSGGQAVNLQDAKKEHNTTKKTIPLYIGLATGFCGSFTSFSSFIRDTFLSLSNTLPTPLNHPEDYSPVLASTVSTVTRNAGYSVMALLAVIITTVALCISAFFIGAHLATALEAHTPSPSFSFLRQVLDRTVVVLAWGCWLGAIILTILPPDRNSRRAEIWRGRALFSIVFAPLGCIARFYTSLYLNGKIASFPLGTFIVNIVGTVILGMSYDLQRVPLGGVIGCQVLQGVQDGFCGCLTTVSTWVAELTMLRRRYAYLYGVASVVVALCFLVIIMGSMLWTRGFTDLQCTH